MPAPVPDPRLPGPRPVSEEDQLRAAARAANVTFAEGTRRRLAIRERIDLLDRKVERAERDASAARDDVSRRRFEARAARAFDEMMSLVEQIAEMPGRDPDPEPCRRCGRPAVFDPYESSLCAACRGADALASHH